MRLRPTWTSSHLDLSKHTRNMPRVRKFNTASLSIILDETRDSYLPGDSISGRIQRIAPIVAADAEIKISLVGRAETQTAFKQLSERGTSTVTHKGLYRLIDPSDNNYTVCQGPLHIPEDGGAQEWPFSFTIPRHPASSRAPDDWFFLPVDAASVEGQTLPVSFHYTNPEGHDQGLVDYHLEAELHVHHSGKSTQKDISTAPFFLRNYRDDPPMINSELRRDKYGQQLTSQRLIPGMEKAELSVSQKVKKIFGTSSVPTLSYRVDMDVPQVIQLENPNYVPFRVRAVPIWDETSEILRDVPQTVRLKHISLVIEEIGGFRCNECKNVHRAQPYASTTVSLDRALAQLQQPLEISLEESARPYDVGTAAKLAFGTRGIASLDGTSCHARIIPSCTTINIKTTHKLTYMLKGEIAGEQFVVKPLHPSPVNVLLPSDPRLGEELPEPPLRSESWIRPPDYDQLEAPPAFAEVEHKSNLN